MFCYINQSSGEALLMELGPPARLDRFDVTDRKEVQTWVDPVLARYGRIDVLINNAGITSGARFVKLMAGELVKQVDEAAFNLLISLNLEGGFNCTQAVTHSTIKQGCGMFINASSAAGLSGN